MRALEIKRKLKDNIESIYLLTGDDDYLKNYVIGALLEKSPIEDRDFCYEVFENKFSVDDLLGTLGTICFVDSIKIVVAKNCDIELNKTEKKELAEYANDPTEKTILVLINCPCILAAVGEKAIIVDCNKAKEDEIVDYIAFLLQRKKCSMDKFAAKQVIASCNGELGKIEREIEKLIQYSNGEKNITMADIELLTPTNTEIKIYELTNAIQQENFTLALSILNTLSERGEKAVVILATITAAYRKLFLVANSTASDEQLMQLLVLSPKALKMNKSIVETNKKKNRAYVPLLKETLDYFYNLEYSFKSGQISQESAMSLAFVKLVAQNSQKEKNIR